MNRVFGLQEWQVKTEFEATFELIRMHNMFRIWELKGFLRFRENQNVEHGVTKKRNAAAAQANKKGKWFVIELRLQVGKRDR